MDEPTQKRKPGKINKFLQAYMEAASNEDSQAKASSPVKPVRKLNLAELSFDTYAVVESNEKGKTGVAEMLAVSSDQPSVGKDELNESIRQTHFEFYHAEEATAKNESELVAGTNAVIVSQTDQQPVETNDQLEEETRTTSEESLTKEEKQARRQELCPTPQIPSSAVEGQQVGVFEDDLGTLGIDLSGIDEDDVEARDDDDDATLRVVSSSAEVDFDAGSVIDNEEEHFQVAEDTLEAPFEQTQKPVEQVQRETPTAEKEKKILLDTSTDTISTADITQENIEIASPAHKETPSSKSRFSRSFSKAKLRFEKRKSHNVKNGANSRSNEVDSKAGDAAKEVVDSTGATGTKLDKKYVNDVDEQSEFNPDTVKSESTIFNVYESPSADEFCRESYQAGSDVSNPKLGGSDGSATSGSKFSFYSSMDADRRSEAAQSSTTDDIDCAQTGATAEFSFYSSTSTDLYGDEKKESSFDENNENAGMKFGFYSSTPLDNTSLGDDNLRNEESVNSSFLAEENMSSSSSKREPDQVGFYTSTPMNMESFDGSDAIVGEDELVSSVNTTRDESTGEGFDEDHVDEILSVTQKQTSNGELTEAKTIDTFETEYTSPTTFIETIHAKTRESANSSPLMKKYQLGRSLDVTASTLANYKVSTSIFTKQEIDSITPLQITNYLTLDERKSIGMRVLSEKMMRGYTIVVSTGEEDETAGPASNSTVCSVCDMPLLCKNGKNLESCVICPTLKKKVLKRIMNPNSCQKTMSQVPNSSQDAIVSDARRELLDVSKRKSYYDRQQQQQSSKTKSELSIEGRSAVQNARYVLAGSVVNDNVKASGNMSPRILFPDDGSVEVQVVQSGSQNMQTREITHPPPSFTKTPSPEGRPPLVPPTPAVMTPKVVASDTIRIIQHQIDDTKGKVLHAQDQQRQMLYSDLLIKESRTYCCPKA